MEFSPVQYIKDRLATTDTEGASENGREPSKLYECPSCERVYIASDMESCPECEIPVRETSQEE